MEDDLKFKEATGILKLIALGAHHVRFTRQSVHPARPDLLTPVSALLSVLDRVHPLPQTQTSVARPTLPIGLVRRRPRTSSPRHPLLPHPRQQTLRLMGVHQLHETARAHRRQFGRNTG